MSMNKDLKQLLINILIFSILSIVLIGMLIIFL